VAYSSSETRKGFKYINHILFFALLLAAPALSAPDAVKQPIYIYLYARVTDHVNMDVTEDRLHRLLPMVEKYRKAHPEAHLSATVLFSGAVSQALADRNSQTHIVEFVRDYIRRGVIEAGYDGTDEPTYEHRPLLDFSTAQTAEDRWLVREAADEKLLTEARDPLTGTPVPNNSGGLKKMREVFGDPSCITGMTMWRNVRAAGPASHALTPDEETPNPHFNRPLTRRNPPLSGLIPEVGGDSELVQLLRRDHIQAIMFGIPDGNPGFVPGISLGRAVFGKFMSPDVETSPEIYWQDDVLRSSETSGTVRLLHAYDGKDAIKAAIDKTERSRIHVVHVEIASEQNYLQPAFIKGGEFPPLKYAYNHPPSPLLPRDAKLPAADVAGAFAKEDAVLKWLVEDFFPADPASHIVSNKELMQMALPSTGFSIPVASLRGALADLLKAAGNDTVLPTNFRVDGHYLSLANMFQAMTDALADYGRTGKLPESVKVVPVYGPVRLLTGHGPNVGEVSVESVVRVCTQIDTALHDDSPDKFPKNAIPVYLKVDGINMNPVQFLRLMALALVAPAMSPEARLQVRMLYPFTGTLISYPKTRPMTDCGFGWTLKPAPLQTERGARQQAHLGP
jgi:hypothetical protein